MKIYDVVVIGGGPAGLIATGRAAEFGARVLLLEKNKTLGVKLLMTGGGRCNFTNQSSARVLAEAFGENGRWLLSGLTRFGSDDIINFFTERGLKIKVEAGGRVFPENNDAREILKLLIDYIKLNNGEIKTEAKVVKIIKDGDKIFKLILSDETEVRAKNFIIATGGKSYPLSGSSGDAYDWLTALGHKIISPKAALSPIIVKESVEDLEGLSLSGAKIKLFQGDKKVAESAGDFIFTACGLSGPAALSLSRAIARFNNKNLKLKIDFSPETSNDELKDKIKDLIANNKQVDIKNILAKIYPKRLVNFVLTVCQINPEKKGNGITRLECQVMLNFFKDYELQVLNLGGFAEAMITVGGIDLKEVNPKTMASKILPNLYLAGEVLDLDGPTGGYNLQAAWTTGYLAGENAAVIRE